MNKPLSIGILGAANIAKRAILEPAQKLENVRVVGLASRSKERAEKFAQDYQIERVFPSYDALIESDEIDAVYIPLANHLHADWVIKTAQAKKPILVEKPICLTTEEFDRIEQSVEENGIPILEALMVLHHPWQHKLQEIIQTEIYGQVKSVETHLTVPFPEEQNLGNYRFLPEQGGGAFFDLGTYWIQLVQMSLGLQPDTIEAQCELNRPGGVDVRFEALLNFPQGSSAKFYCSFEHSFEAHHWVKLEKAEIKIRNFFRPIFGQSITLDVCPVGTEDIEKIKFPAQNYYENQLQFFSQVIAGEAENLPRIQARERVKIMEKIYNLAEKKSRQEQKTSV
ncbi:MAG: Gfo/Idh/MocA family oxidoreductase [Limnoraphis sp. WC205]|nr:Gfo/Idh/MocA family oxidoreductase [Limnoraphis sp. WC205]